MSLGPEIPASRAADQAWGRLMHTLHKKVPRRLHNAELARRQIMALTRKVR